MSLNKEDLIKSNWQLKTLEEISEDIYSGNEVTNAQKDTGSHPAIKTKDISELKKIFLYECKTFVDENLIKNKKTFKKGDILIIANSGSKKIIGKTCLYLGEKKCIAGQGIYVIRHKQNSRFLIHVLNSKYFKKQIRKIIRGTPGMPGRISINEIKTINVLLPPIEIQEKIANYLDNFFELSKELEEMSEEMSEEIKKQYEHYKNLIFNKGINELNWELKTLEDVATEIIVGNQVTESQLKTGNHPAVKCGDINSILKQQFDTCISFVNLELIKNPKYFEKGDVLMSNMSNKISTLGTTLAYLGEDKCLAGDHVVILKNNQNSKYLTYALSSNLARNQIKKLTRIGIVCELRKSSLKKIKIPLPSLKEQENVVEILDKFYIVSNNMKEGIPGLIQDIQKKYEYCREEILKIN